MPPGPPRRCLETVLLRDLCSDQLQDAEPRAASRGEILTFSVRWNLDARNVAVGIEYYTKMLVDNGTREVFDNNSLELLLLLFVFFVLDLGVLCSHGDVDVGHGGCTSQG
jgi:hypothetical protein